MKPGHLNLPKTRKKEAGKRKESRQLRKKLLRTVFLELSGGPEWSDFPKNS
jgi:hypothetical protein